MLGDSLVDKVWCSFLKLYGVLTNAEILGVPRLGEIVAVVNKALAAVKGELISAEEISRRVVVLSAEGHAGADGKNG